MTAREKFEIAEKKLLILVERGYQCEICGTIITDNTAQLAHRIPQTKANLKKFGPEVIHSAENILVVCSLRCNSLANIGNKPELIKTLVNFIRSGRNEQ